MIDSGQLIELEKAPFYRGIEYVDFLLYSIVNQRLQRIAYQKFTARQPEDDVFHPYLLKEYTMVCAWL